MALNNLYISPEAMKDIQNWGIVTCSGTLDFGPNPCGEIPLDNVKMPDIYYKSKKSCNCDIIILMRSGCQCGGI